MKFLISTVPKFPLPPEAAPSLLDALAAWADRYEAEGKLDAIWANAGKAGGGGIANVDSLDELDGIMAEFPIAPFSDIKIVPIVDLSESLERVKKAFLAMAGGS